ncbi:MAG: hypothetical protein QX203_00930 [Methylococcaceae bacterium]
MKNKIMITATCLLIFGCTNLKYPNWQYVRIENQVPDKSCVYKIQEACSQRANECMDWHKQRATKFDANTVVITDRSNQNQFSTGMWGVRGGDNTSTLAEYYFCMTAKNIIPKD